MFIYFLKGYGVVEFYNKKIMSSTGLEPAVTGLKVQCFTIKLQTQ